MVVANNNSVAIYHLYLPIVSCSLFNLYAAKDRKPPSTETIDPVTKAEASLSSHTSALSTHQGFQIF